MRWLVLAAFSIVVVVLFLIVVTWLARSPWDDSLKRRH